MRRREYKYEVILEGVVVYSTFDDRDPEEVISIIKRGLKHIFEDEDLNIEFFISTEAHKNNK